MIKTLHVPIGLLAKQGFKANQQLFLTMVLSFRHTETGCRMSHSGIAQHLNVSRPTVINMVSGLQKNGWVSITHITNDGENESNLYQPTEKLLNLVGPGKENTPGPGKKNVSPAGKKTLQNTLLSEEKSIAEEADAIVASALRKKDNPEWLKEYTLRCNAGFTEKEANELADKKLKQKQTV